MLQNYRVVVDFVEESIIAEGLRRLAVNPFFVLPWRDGNKKIGGGRGSNA
ncbi:MAG: hypothetical protein ABJA37_04925 [Ferruginibacter sp.]